MEGSAPFIRRAPVTSLLLLVCAGVFVLMCLKGSFEGGPSFDDATLRRFGALDPERVWQGEWWRLLSAGLVHGDPLHILFNSWALIALGPALERILSPPRALLLLVGSQLGCTATHVCFGSMAPLVGASGIACGMLGALLVAQVRRGATPIEGARRGALAFWALQVLIFSLLIPGISLLGHLGGGLAGAALMVGLEPDAERRRERAVSTVFACALIAVAVRLAVVEPDRADWNIAKGFQLYNHHRFAEAVPFFRRGLERGPEGYRGAIVRALLGDALLEAHDRDAGLPELAQAAEEGSSAAAEKLAEESSDPHRALAFLAESLELAPSEQGIRPDRRDRYLRELTGDLVRQVGELAAHGELPTAADFAPLVHVPEEPAFATTEAVRALALAVGGDPQPLRDLTAPPRDIDGGGWSPAQPLAVRLQAALQADGGTTLVARALQEGLAQSPSCSDTTDAGPLDEGDDEEAATVALPE